MAANIFGVIAAKVGGVVCVEGFDVGVEFLLDGAGGGRHSECGSVEGG